MTLTTFTSGVNETFSSELNANFLAVNNKVLSSYTGTLSVSGTTSSTYEPTEIPASDLTDKTYVLLIATYAWSGRNSSTGSGSNSYTIETKYVGGSYATDINGTGLSMTPSNQVDLAGTSTIIFAHVLTASEIALGLQIRISTSSSVSGTNSSSSLSNKQFLAIGCR